MGNRKNKKLKILAAADIHGDSTITKTLAEKAEKQSVDLVILCGDITGFVNTKNIIKPFRDKNKEVFLIPGNHDFPAAIDFLAKYYKMKNLHEYSLEFQNVGFFGTGHANLSPLSKAFENEMFKGLKRAHSYIKNMQKKIMITHMHPFKSLSEASGFEGSHAITKAIKQFKPDILLHGHIHEAAGVEELIGNTRVLNVGREGKIIEI